ncbi:uncharacterized protein VTP21DRAFT_2591 [Calcarisporiella thermophila]|uniref:uncharacterized protein n=1 Tax=Calcarisporiella thermophila TaxID=911321 RepID=UPI003743198D
MSKHWNEDAKELGKMSDSSTATIVESEEEINVENNVEMFYELERRITHELTSQDRDRDPKFFNGDIEKGDKTNEFDLRDYFESGVRASDEHGIRRQKMGVVFRNLTVVGRGADASNILTNLTPFVELVKLFNPFNWFKANNGTVFDILHNVTGYCPDGEMLLVLGRPGAGCTSFLRAIANIRKDFLDVKGDIHYGGIPSEDFGDYLGEAIYCMEEDSHYPVLTVNQTLDFALRMKTPEKRLPGVSRKLFRNEFKDTLLRMFGLSRQANTIVGNEFIRGLSGGERKRLTISEAMVARSAITTWDCPTRGLDSASALDYVKSLRIQCDTLNKTTIATIYQASDSIYELFDKVLILYLGRCIFFGPRSRAKAYFEEMGFKCEPRKSTPDFLTGITNPNERVVREGFEGKTPNTPEEFESYFLSSMDYQVMLNDIANYEKKIENEQPATEFKQYVKDIKQKGVPSNSVYSANFYEQCIALTIRQFQLIWGDKTALYQRYLNVLAISCIYGSVFYKMALDSTGVFQRGGAILGSLIFNSFLAQAELPNVIFGRMTLQKHKSYAMYHPSAFHVARATIILYFMYGLDLDAGKFFIFLFINFLSTLAMTEIFRFLGNISPSIYVSQQLFGILLVTIIAYSGFSAPYNKLHPWFIWIFWINPFAYAFKALLTNEMRGLIFQCDSIKGLAPSGPGYNDKTHQVCTLAGSKGGEFFVTGDDFLDAAYGYKTSQMNIDIIAVLLFWLLFVVLNCIAMEKIQWIHGGFVRKVYKKGKAPTLNGEQELKRLQASQEAYNAISNNFSKVAGIFKWRNINYTVPVNKGTLKLLDDVEGWIKPGEMTALMGSSGAGKTTLLDVLAKRKTIGIIQGDILLNGNVPGIDFERITGYVEQSDVHNPALTVREALRFSAKMRQDANIPLAEKYEYVENILKMMEMEHLGDALIGSLETGVGISVEERKRLTIGMELVSKPTILFLDEPTSGLDAQSSYNIIKFIRKLADAGMAIICTIHQPSSILFEHFDRLLLLARGGKTAYFGDIGVNSRIMLDYFERNGGRICDQHENSAEYILEVIGAGASGKVSQDWTEVWKNSPERSAVLEEMGQLTISPQTVSNGNTFFVLGYPSEIREFATSTWVQIWEVYKRMNLCWWRDPYYNIGRIGQTCFIGLLNGFTFWKLRPTTSDLQMYSFVAFQNLIIGVTLVFAVQPQFLMQRQYFHRDYASKYYGFLPFAVAFVLVEIPYLLVAAAAAILPLWWSAGVDSTAVNGIYSYLILVVLLLVSLTCGMAVASMCQTLNQINIVTPFVNFFLYLFAGFLTPPAVLVYFWRAWMYPLDPFHYFLEGAVTAILEPVKIDCVEEDFFTFTPPPGQTCIQYAGAWLNQTTGYLKDNNAMDLCKYCQYSNGAQYYAQFEWSADNQWRDFGILWAYWVFNVLIFTFFVWVMRKPRR